MFVCIKETSKALALTLIVKHLDVQQFVIKFIDLSV